MDRTTQNPLFSETQPLRATWFWIVVLLLLLLPVVCILLWLVFFNPEKQVPVSAFVFLSGFLLLVSFILFTKLETKIFPSEIRYKYKPLHRKFRTIAMDGISRIYVCRYSPIGEYGGYGLRFRFGDGWALSVSGNMGIQIEMKDGKKILIGTRKPEEAERILQSLRDYRS